MYLYSDHAEYRLRLSTVQESFLKKFSPFLPRRKNDLPKIFQSQESHWRQPNSSASSDVFSSACKDPIFSKHVSYFPEKDSLPYFLHNNSYKYLRENSGFLLPSPPISPLLVFLFLKLLPKPNSL